MESSSKEILKIVIIPLVEIQIGSSFPECQSYSQTISQSV